MSGGDRRGDLALADLPLAEAHACAREALHDVHVCRLGSGLVQLVTWTQKGNEAMQAINRSLGYVDHARVLTYTGPLPPPLR